MNNTVIVNGSPKGSAGNTEIFIRRFIKGVGNQCNVYYAANNDPSELAALLVGYDAILVFMPLYVHAMPGCVMKLFEQLKPAREGQRLGCFVQHGFVESAQSDYLKPYIDSLAEELNYINLGTVVKGNSAGVCYMPDRMNKQLFEQLETMGRDYRATGKWHAQTVQQLAEPHKLTKGKVRMYTITTKLGLNNFFWHNMMKKNNGFESRMDRPFLNG